MNLKVYGYTGWYAKKPKIIIYFDGREIGQVGYNEVFDGNIENDGELLFKCSIRKSSVKIYKNKKNVIHLEFNRLTGKLVADCQYLEKTNNEVMFKCSECGKDVPGDAKLCPYCGEKFDEEE